MRSTLFPLLWLLASGATGQQMSPTIGRFLDLNGEPVAGATVTLATSPLGVHDAFEPTAVVTAATDDKGWFRTKLNSGVPYSAWATGPRTAEGCVRSQVLEGVVPGDVVEIVAATHDDHREVRMLDLERLGKEGPFTVRFRVDACHAPEQSLLMSKEGVVSLPPLPAGRIRARIHAADGTALVLFTDLGNQWMACAEPRQMEFVVRDPNGKPIKGAHVSTVIADFLGNTDDPFLRKREWRGRADALDTDAQGRTKLTVRDVGRHYVAYADGYALSVAGVFNGDWVESSKFVAKQPKFGEWPDKIEFVLQPVKRITGRLRDGDALRSGVGIRYTTDLRIDFLGRGMGTGWSSIGHTEDLRTDDQGRFRIDVPQPASGHQLWIAPQADRDQPIFLQPRNELPSEPLDLDLATFPKMTFHVVDQEGSPSSRGRVVLLPGDKHIEHFDPIVLPTDRAGRAPVQLEPGRWFVFATDGQGQSHQVLDVRPGVDIAVRLSLEGLARMSGRVLTKDGKPVPTSRFSLGGWSSEPHADDITLLEELRRKYMVLLNRGLMNPVRTAEDGTFEIRFLPVDGVRGSFRVQRPGSPVLTLAEESGVEIRLTR